MELVAKLLLAIEGMAPGERGFELPEGYDEKLITDHLFIMWDAGLIDGRDVSCQDCRRFMLDRMTWAGHEFLDSIQKGDAWQQLRSKWKDAPFEIVLDLAKALVKQKFGLKD
jgi:hypothetical protein